MTDSNTPPPFAPPPPGTGGGSRPSELHIHLQRVLPVAQSLLWHPTSPAVGVRRQPSGVYPVFFDQKAIAAVQVHYETAGRQGMMGFLVGDLFECPTSHVRYVVIDSTIRLNQAVYGDKTLVIVSRLWDRVQDELRKTEGHLIGWYHSHPPIGVELAPGDVETHLQYFKRPWHVALVLGTEHEGPVGGLFRPRPGETSVSLPFYELIESDEGFAGGKKRSILPWINLLTDDPAVVYAETHGEGAPPPTAAASVAAGPTLQVVRPPAIKSGPVRAVPASPPRTPPPPPAPPPPTPATAPRPGLTARPTPRPGSPVAPASGEVPAMPAKPAPPAPPAQPAQVRSFTPSPPGRRDPQMKPPPNALSDLPLLAAGGYDIGESDARESNPDVVTPRSRETAPVAPPPPRPQRTIAPRPAPHQPSRSFAPALAQRKGDGHPGLVALVILLLLGGGGYAGWWFLLRKPAETTTSAGTSTSATTALPPGAPATPSTPPVDSALLRFERVSDSVTAVVGAYETSMRQFDTKRVNCQGLSQALVAVEDAWTDYNVGKRKAGTLDPGHASRDQSLYAAVDSVERTFDRSGCQRP